jgi:hypothetical protein
MPDDVTTESLVAAAVREADFPSDPSDRVADVGEPAVGSPPDSSPEPESLEPERLAERAATPDTDEDPDLTAIMKGYGIDWSNHVQQDNRMPYSRHRKVLAKTVRQVHAKVQELLGTHTGKLTAAEARLKNFEAADTLVQTDPERYINVLAAMYPEQYGRFTHQSDARPDAANDAATRAATTESIPRPDVQFEDGSVGYSPEQQDRRELWLVNKAKTDALAEVTELFSKRFAPLEDRLKAEQAHAEYAPRVKAQLDHAVATWGEAFTAEYQKGNASEIIQVLHKADAAGIPLTFEAACTQVLLPRLQHANVADREKMRTELLGELSKRPGAARLSAPSATKPDVSDTNRTTQDIVREAMAAAQMR